MGRGVGAGEGSVEVHGLGLDDGVVVERVRGDGGVVDAEMGGVGEELRQQVATAVMQVVETELEMKLEQEQPLAPTALAPEAAMAV